MKKFKRFYWILLVAVGLLAALAYIWIDLGTKIESESNRVWPVITKKAETVETYKQWDISDVLPVVSGEYPPFIYTEAGVVKGLSYEIFDMVMKEMKLSYHLEMTSWSRGLNLLETGDAFAALPYTQSESRKETHWFTKPIHQATDSVENFYFYAGDLSSKAMPSTLEELKNYSLGGIYGYYHLEWFEANQLKVDLSINEIEAFNKLKAGKIDSFALNSVVADYFIRNNFKGEEGNFIKSSLMIQSESAGDCVMLSKKNELAPEFIEQFNKTYDKLLSEGKVEAILKKYNFQ